MSGSDCMQFQRRLDAAGPSAGSDLAAAGHAATCPDCASRLAAERAVSALFAPVARDATATAIPALPGFVDRVMARVALTPQARPVAAAPVPVVPAADALPWWIRVAARREVAAACLLAGLLLLLAPRLAAFARSAPQWGAMLRETLASAIAPFLAPVAGPVAGHPLVGAGVALGFLPLVALLAWALYLLGLQLARVRLAPTVASGRRA